MRFYSNYGHIWVNFTFIDLKIKTHNALVLISGKKKKKNLYELKDSKFILMSTIEKNKYKWARIGLFGLEFEI